MPPTLMNAAATLGVISTWLASAAPSETMLSWYENTAPEFVAGAGDIVGLDIEPPEYPSVICGSKKPWSRTLERRHRHLQPPNGRTLIGRSADSKRNGRSSLFAALELATGKVTFTRRDRCRRVELLDATNGIVATLTPGIAIHVVLNSHSAFKPHHDPWLTRLPDPSVPLHVHPAPLFPHTGNMFHYPAESQHVSLFGSVKEVEQHANLNRAASKVGVSVNDASRH